MKHSCTHSRTPAPPHWPDPYEAVPPRPFQKSTCARAPAHTSPSSDQWSFSFPSEPNSVSFYWLKWPWAERTLARDQLGRVSNAVIYQSQQTESQKPRDYEWYSLWRFASWAEKNPKNGSGRAIPCWMVGREQGSTSLWEDNVAASSGSRNLNLNLLTRESITCFHLLQDKSSYRLLLYKSLKPVFLPSGFSHNFINCRLVKWLIFRPE